MENLKKIIKQFPKVGEVKEIKALTSGLINQTYLVKSVSPEEPDYVLQRINHLIFTNIENAATQYRSSNQTHPPKAGSQTRRGH